MALGSALGSDVGPGFVLAAGGSSIFEIVALAGMLLLVLMLVALAGVAYRGLVGDGIRWPDEDEQDDELSRGSADDDWKYY